MRILLAQNTPAMESPGMDNMANPNAAGMDNMANSPSKAGGTFESRSNLSGLGEMVAGPNIAGSAEQYGGSPATMMRASGGSIPGLSEISAQNASPGKNTDDVAILNSALLLEYLESEFYSRVVAADQTRSYLHGRSKYVAQVLARDEASHVQTVTEMITKLGGTPVQKPQFQFPANIFISPVAFLQLSVELEENGVGAYLGAAPMVRNKDVLNFAASIYGIEARHTAWIRFLLGETFAPRELEQPRTLAEATANAMPYIVPGTMMAPDAMSTGAMAPDAMSPDMAAPVTQ